VFVFVLLKFSKIFPVLTTGERPLCPRNQSLE